MGPYPIYVASDTGEFIKYFCRRYGGGMDIKIYSKGKSL